MHPHPNFDLLLHSDAELAAHLGAPIVERVTLHQWSLSCVQRVTLAGGRRLVYKSQSQPSVENAFYRAARSPLLIDSEPLWADDRHSASLTAWLDSSSLDKMDLPHGDLMALVEEVVEAIGQIEGDPPAYQAVGGGAWPRFVDEVLGELAALIRSGQFRATSPLLLTRLDAWSRDPAVLALAQGESRLIHADLTGDNLFVVKGRPLVIDWQYPRTGPPALDGATLLDSLGIDPRPFTPPATLNMLFFVRLGWLTACAARWFPPGSPTYEKQIARLATQILTPEPAIPPRSAAASRG